MKKEIEFILRDVYGGDGQVRYEDVEVPKLERQTTTTKKKSDIGIPIESTTDEVTTEVRKADIQTFRYDNGYPVLRLGGTHGKLWGALEEARKTLNMLGENGFRNKGITRSIQIQPVWIRMEPLEALTVAILPQILNTVGRSMIAQRFDVIPKCKAVVQLIYPDNIATLVERLLEQIKSMGLLNKRRATIEEMKVIG